MDKYKNNILGSKGVNDLLKQIHLDVKKNDGKMPRGGRHS